jgi:hypothetical protein
VVLRNMFSQIQQTKVADFIAENIAEFSLSELSAMGGEQIRRLFSYHEIDFKLVAIDNFADVQRSAEILSSKIYAEQDIFYEKFLLPETITSTVRQDLKDSLVNYAQEDDLHIENVCSVFLDCLSLCAKLSDRPDVRARMELNRATLPQKHFDGDLERTDQFIVLFIANGPQTRVTPDSNIIGRRILATPAGFLRELNLRDHEFFEAAPSGYALILKAGKEGTGHIAPFCSGHRSLFAAMSC